MTVLPNDFLLSFTYFSAKQFIFNEETNQCIKTHISLNIVFEEQLYKKEARTDGMGI